MSVSDRDNAISQAIVDCAFRAHKQLGPGLLEKIYETCLIYELEQRDLKVERQKPVPIRYGKITFDEGLRLDLLIEDSVIVELKAAEKPNALWQAQLLSYLRLTGKRLGLIINFNSPLIKQGIQRVAL